MLTALRHATSKLPHRKVRVDASPLHGNKQAFQSRLTVLIFESYFVKHCCERRLLRNISVHTLNFCCATLFQNMSRKLHKHTFNLDVRKFSFSQRVINHWNALTQHAIDCNTVNSFKRCVDHYIRDKGY